MYKVRMRVMMNITYHACCNTSAATRYQVPGTRYQVVKNNMKILHVTEVSVH